MPYQMWFFCIKFSFFYQHKFIFLLFLKSYTELSMFSLLFPLSSLSDENSLLPSSSCISLKEEILSPIFPWALRIYIIFNNLRI